MVLENGGPFPLNSSSSDGSLRNADGCHNSLDALCCRQQQHGQEHGVRTRSSVQPLTRLAAHHRGTRATLRLVTTALCTPASMLIHHRSEALCTRYVPPEVLVAGDCLNVMWLVLRRGKHLQTEIVLHEGSKRAQLLKDHAQCLKPPLSS